MGLRQESLPLQGARLPWRVRHGVRLCLWGARVQILRYDGEQLTSWRGDGTAETTGSHRPGRLYRHSGTRSARIDEVAKQAGLSGPDLLRVPAWMGSRWTGVVFARSRRSRLAETEPRGSSSTARTSARGASMWRSSTRVRAQREDRVSRVYGAWTWHTGRGVCVQRDHRRGARRPAFRQRDRRFALNGKVRGGEGPRERCSKALSLVLRHDAENLGLGMSRDGFVALQDVLALPHLRGFTEGDVRGVVRYCEKSPPQRACSAG